MKVLFIIVFVAMIAIIVVNLVWSNALIAREKKYQDNLSSLRQSEYAYHKRLELHNAELEMLAREKEQFKDRELNLAARNTSVLELEATLTNKQTYLAGLESELNDRAETLAKKAKELEAAAKVIEPYIPDVIEPVDEPQKPVKKAKKGGRK